MEFTTATAPALIGRELALSDWLTISQPRVTSFADCTLDPDWMHVDVERSKRESPYQGTIVQGFLMQSLVIYFLHEAKLQPTDAAYGLNYGTDRVRFLMPVVTGSRVRDRIVLTDFRARGEDRYLMKTTHNLELEGSEKPAMVAEWLVLWFRHL